MKNTSFLKTFVLFAVASAVLIAGVSCSNDVVAGNFRLNKNGELSVVDKNAVPEQVLVSPEIDGVRVRKIVSEAFMGCTKVEEIIISEGIEEIGERAFANCPALKKVHFPGSIGTLPENLFDGSDKAKSYMGSIENATEYSAINASDFQSKVIDGSTTKPVLLKFGAYWCPPSNAMEEYLPFVAGYFDERLDIYSIDIDDDPDYTLVDSLLDAYKVTDIPVVLLCIDGMPVWKCVGNVGKDKLQTSVEEELVKAGKM